MSCFVLEKTKEDHKNLEKMRIVIRRDAKRDGSIHPENRPSNRV
jgi:hypothetical protein